MTRVLAGIDIGGTKIGVCLGNADGRVLEAHRFPFDPAVPPIAVLDQAVQLLEEMMASRGIAAIDALGVPCPGPIDYKRQAFVDPPNMPTWHGFAIVDALRDRCSAPVKMMNDANATALAEWKWGAARGTDTAIYLTMSTGMGAGLVLGGRIFEGPLGLAGEIGHIRLRPDGPVGFGKRGSVEGYLSGPGMLQVAQSEARLCEQIGEPTILRDPGLTVEQVCVAAGDASDAAAVRVIDRCGEALGELIALLTDLLNPDVVILGTIGSAHLDLFASRARTVVDREAIGRSAQRMRICASGLSDRSSQSALAVAAEARV